MLRGDDGRMARDPVATGLRIAKRRHQLGMLQGELAARLGVAVSTVSNWERGNSFPLRHLGAVEAVLGISLGGEPEHEPVPDENEQVILSLDWLTPAEQDALLERYRRRRNYRAAS